MLVIGRKQFAAHFRWFVATAVLTAAATAWFVAESAGRPEWPSGSSRVGLTLGVLGALIILFEMLLWPRKRFPKMRTLPLGRTKYWMKAHIWLGLLCVPFAVLHTGFRLGGPLPAALMVVFGIVILSGIWGLILQHILPKRMLDLVPGEVPAAEIERVMTLHAHEFAAKLEVDRGRLGTAPLAGAETVAKFFEADARAYLVGENRSPDLAVPGRASEVFARLAEAAGAASGRARELEELCELRRRLDRQAKMHWWLHNWVWVHLPLSVGLTGLLVAHIYTALRYM